MRQPYAAPFESRPKVWLIDPHQVEHEGRYLITLTRGGRAVPASVMREPSGRDPDWMIWTYRLLGKITDRRAFEGKAGRPCSEDEYQHQIELWDWGRRNRPAEFDPRKPFDVAEIPSIF